MPRKNIYIRDDDLPFFENALEKLGKDKEAVGAIIVDALKDKISQLEETQERAFKLQMLYLLGTLNYPPLKELAEKRLEKIPEEAKNKAYLKAYYSYLGNKDHFENTQYFLDNDWYLDFIWNGIEGLMNDKEEWFEEGKKNIDEGKKRHEEGKNILDEDNLENE